MPTVDHVGVSRKIESRDERSRLRGIVREFRESHGFTGGVIIRTAAAGRPQEDIVQHRGVPQDLDRDPPEDRVAAGAGGRLPRTEPRVQAAPGSPDRGVSGDPHRPRAGTPARARPDRADHAEPRPAREALLEAVPDLRGVRRAGRDRQGAEEQGVAEIGRLDRHQPDRGARGDRRQHRALRRQAHQRTPRRHHRQDEPRSGENRAASPAARSGRHHRPRRHRHGGRRTGRRSCRRSSRSSARIGRRPRRCRCRTSAWSSSRGNASSRASSAC